MSVKSFRLALSLFLLNCVVVMTVFGQGGGANWTSAGSDLRNSRNAASESKINKTNVAGLKTKWVYTAHGEISATPTVEGDAVYVTDWGNAAGGFIQRVNNKTGTVVWERNVSDFTGVAGSLSRTSPAIQGNSIIIGTQRRFFGGPAYVVAINKATGDLIWRALADAHPSAIVTQSPVIQGNRVYVGTASTEELIAGLTPGYELTFRGSFAAYNLQTGEQVWKTYTVPEGYTGGGVWGSTAVVDNSRGTVYISTGNNYSVPASVQSCVDAVRLNTYPNPGEEAAAEEACLAPDDYIDAVMALDMQSGAIKWANRVEGADTWHVGCFLPYGDPCPDILSPDYDFGSGPNMFTVKGANGKPRDLIGAGQKSGVYWAFDPDTGDVVWSTLVGPGSSLGGIEWGSATDGERIYVAIANYFNIPYTLAGGAMHNAGSFAALNPATGQILWQVKVPQSNPYVGGFSDYGLGPLAVANGVVFGAAFNGQMTALNAATGATLWNYTTPVGGVPPGSNICGASIANGTVYWGTGYTNLGFGNTDNRLFAFTPSN